MYETWCTGRPTHGYAINRFVLALSSSGRRREDRLLQDLAEARGRGSSANSIRRSRGSSRSRHDITVTVLNSPHSDEGGSCRCFNDCLPRGSSAAGKRFFPDGVLLDLELVEERSFRKMGSFSVAVAADR